MELRYLTIALILATSAVRLAGSLYQPAMPAIAADFGASEAAISATMTVYFLGLAISNIFMGPLSDSFGRRPLILAGLITVAAGSTICMFANGISILIAGRIVQAIGTSTIPVTSRAVIRDAYPEDKIVSILGITGIISALVPIAAPFAGGLITQYFNWKITFIISSACCIVSFFYAYLRLKETNPPEKRYSLEIAQTIKNYFKMLLDRTFMSAAIPNMIFFGIQGIYLTLGPFIFMGEFNYSPVEFGLTYIPLVSTLIAGRAVSSPIYRISSRKNTVLIITLISATAGTLLIGTRIICGTNNAATILAAAAIFSFAFGLSIPISTKIGLDQFRHISGAASSMLGTMQMGGAAATAAIGGLLLKYVRASDAFTILVTALAVTLVLTGLSIYIKPPKLRKYD
ncbi:MAG: hypothetical protein A2020_12390 [Lentisphaerae bacterium GWF2_45_14]|nr:MAG: hypothetical protein A2020_12390 [Lentisphaerae bacterium GWF2_45_14]